MTTEPSPAERTRRDFHLALGVFVPLFALPFTWWLAVGALRRERSAGDAESAPWSRRLLALAIFDSAVSALFVLALALADAAPPSENVARSVAVLPPFEPLRGFECSEVWAEAAGVQDLPLLGACVVVAALWLHGNWRRLRGERDRWLLVLLPIAVAPLAGLAMVYATCVEIGGWSIGGSLLGLLFQGLTMLGLGLVAMRACRGELAVIVGPRLTTGRASAVAIFYMIAGIVRIAILIASLWMLIPELRLGDSGIEALLGGEHGLLGRVLILAAAVVVAPLAEEVVFRGVLLPGLVRRMSPTAALLWSSAVFALLHVPSHGTAAVAPGVLGFAFGWARLRTGSLVAPILLHAANNFIVTVIAWWTMGVR